MVVVTSLLLPIDQLPQPVEPFRITAAASGRPPLLVFPVGSNPEFGNLVHLQGSNLHFDRTMTTDHRCMQRLIAIRLRQADVVLEPSGDRAKRVMHHSQGAITRLNTWRNDAKRCHVVDLVERLLLTLHFAPDAVEVFRPPTHLTALKPRALQAFIQ